MVVINGDQWSWLPVVIIGYQWLLMVTSGYCRLPVVIVGYQWLSVYNCSNFVLSKLSMSSYYQQL